VQFTDCFISWWCSAAAAAAADQTVFPTDAITETAAETWRGVYRECVSKTWIMGIVRGRRGACSALPVLVAVYRSLNAFSHHMIQRVVFVSLFIAEDELFLLRPRIDIYPRRKPYACVFLKHLLLNSVVQYMNIWISKLGLIVIIFAVLGQNCCSLRWHLRQSLKFIDKSKLSKC